MSKRKLSKVKNVETKMSKVEMSNRKISKVKNVESRSIAIKLYVKIKKSV